jgi:hypothetical protein
MSLDFATLHKTLTYQSTAPIQQILADLEEIGQLEQVHKKKRKSSTTILALAVVGCIVSFVFVFIFPPIGVLLLLLCTILIVQMSLKLLQHSWLNPPKYRPELIKKLLEMLSRDMAENASLTTQINLDQPKHDRKKTHTIPHPHRKDWKIDLYRDPWLSLGGKFQDGTRFLVSTTELYQKQYGWKRGRSGKSKYKSKEQSKASEIDIKLNFSQKKYGAIKALKQGAIDAVTLPDYAQIKRLEMSDNYIYLAIKIRHISSMNLGSDLYQAITMMFLSLYQVLNLARILSKKKEAS